MQFETEGGNKEDKPNETQVAMKKLLKQATLIKNELSSESADNKKKPAILNKQVTLTKPQLDEDSNEESRKSSRESSPERKLEDDQKSDEEKVKQKEEKKVPNIKQVSKVNPIKTEVKKEPVTK